MKLMLSNIQQAIKFDSILSIKRDLKESGPGQKENKVANVERLTPEIRSQARRSQSFREKANGLF